jgi:hypothetical protein
VTQEVARYAAAEVHGTGYTRRAFIGLEEPKLQPPPKPKAPEEPDSSKALALHDTTKAQHHTDLEVWREKSKLVAQRRMEQKTTVLPSVYTVVWRQCTSYMRELLRSTDVFQAIEESNDALAILKLIHASTVVDMSQRPNLAHCRHSISSPPSDR